MVPAQPSVNACIATTRAITPRFGIIAAIPVVDHVNYECTLPRQTTKIAISHTESQEKKDNTQRTTERGTHQRTIGKVKNTGNVSLK